MTVDNDKALNPFGATPARALQTVAGNSDAQRAVAEVQAKLLIARGNPRNERECVDKIINAFSRASLAESSQYQYSKGGTDITGPSIRSAEAMAQLWKNIEFGFRELSRGADAFDIPYSEVEAFAWDLENNSRRVLQFRVPHQRGTKKGTYTLTDDREVYELISNQAQRRVRACILALIPGDVVEAAMNQADLTLKASADVSPESIKKMVEAFNKFGVTREKIEKRIQRRLDSIQPAQVMSLKKIYASLRDGMSSPEDWFEMQSESTVMNEVREAAKQQKAKAPKEKEVMTPPAETPAQSDFVVAPAEVRAMIEKATSVEELLLAVDLLRDVADPDEREALGTLYDKRSYDLGLE